MTILNVGDVVGSRYEILSYIDRGGMQEVYRARDALLDRVVALKSPQNKSAEKRFKRSAVVAARVNHANVAKTLDYVEENGRAYLIEEIIEGADFGKVFKVFGGVIDPYSVARILHLLVRGISASHHADVVHRDLKPSNLMSVGGEVIIGLKITDFGIAKLAEEEIAEAVEGGEGSLTASQTAIGALPYMAPEMIQSIKDAGKPSDIWSVGALVYEFLTGKKPFGTGLRAVPAILAGKYDGLPARCRKAQFSSVAAEVFDIVGRCLNVDPKERPTADELVTACGGLCYTTGSREIGVVNRIMDHRAFGFISARRGKDVFFHQASVFADRPLHVGDKVVFARHLGGGSDRAFPVLKAAAS
ncbi:protein kinase [Mesorhizobium sp. LNHC229A00]|uniref:protein kinase domain-containing protein n=1 Tax=Mesorhizobium sp. LNHC229A00 TaxID=1287240 RepID=UPI0003CF1DAA|nr:protein kinase [Mesorhizobium sp. LNHC229A00]ESY92816.1 protein kinase [Mesorhizobium sp. LNHC229A00]